MPLKALKNETQASRLTVRVPDDWRPHLAGIAQKLQIPGRGPTLADAVRALILEGFKSRGIVARSVVQAVPAILAATPEGDDNG